MISQLTNSLIDRLGDRLRHGELDPADIKLLDQFCRSFTLPYEMVLTALREQLDLAPTGRPQKSTHSIIEKLRRERCRLSGIQDLAGCRIIVSDISAQNSAVTSITNIWSPAPKIVDRRKVPSYGYRAVHLIPVVDGKRIEIQVRTNLQHLWAQFSEKIADLLDPAIKYGGGPEKIKELLALESDRISKIEEAQQRLQDIIAQGIDPSNQEVISIRNDLEKFRLEKEQNMNEIIQMVDNLKRESL